jgi:hypothetical protein
MNLGHYSYLRAGAIYFWDEYNTREPPLTICIHRRQNAAIIGLSSDSH